MSDHDQTVDTETGELQHAPEQTSSLKERLSGFSMVPETLSQAMDYASVLSKSNLVPKEYQGKPADVLVAMQMGMEVGLKPLQALQGIAVISGRPSIWGDTLLALVRGSGLLEDFEESFSQELISAYCHVKRRGEGGPVIRSFSKEDAIQAKLWGKQGPWQQYPARMLQMRARAFALRDAFPDVLRGLASAEESQDMGMASRVDTDSEAPQSEAQTKVASIVAARAAQIRRPDDFDQQQAEQNFDQALVNAGVGESENPSPDMPETMQATESTTTPETEAEASEEQTEAVTGVEEVASPVSGEEAQEEVEAQESTPAEQSPASVLRAQIDSAPNKTQLNKRLSEISKLQKEELIDDSARKELIDAYNARMREIAT